MAALTPADNRGVWHQMAQADPALGLRARYRIIRAGWMDYRPTLYKSDR